MSCQEEGTSSIVVAFGGEEGHSHRGGVCCEVHH